MGDLILCNQQLAAMPYYIENVSLNVYSLDELCYYIKNNTCLLDADFMDDELCDWVEHELGLPEVAENLRHIKDGGGILSEFTGCLMSACGYCTPEEQKQIGRRTGVSVRTKKSVEMKNRILKMSKCFSGNMSDKECMEILQIARNTFYKYKRELLAEAEDAGSTVE